jgi:hypothetical protein
MQNLFLLLARSGWRPGAVYDLFVNCALDALIDACYPDTHARALPGN